MDCPKKGECMTIEEDLATVRATFLDDYADTPAVQQILHAALDRIEAERRWLWDGLKIHGEDFAACRQERDALKAALVKSDNENIAFDSEIGRLKAALEEIREVIKTRLSQPQLWSIIDQALAKLENGENEYDASHIATNLEEK